MKFILIRHGETYANTLYGTDKQILIGTLDNELTQLNEKGKMQAEQCGERIKSSNIEINRIFVSDLGRTKETASIIFSDSEKVYTPLLRERCLGDLEGQRLIDVNYDEETKPKQEALNEVEMKLYAKANQGESYIDVYSRVKKFLSQFDYSSNETVAIVSHFHCLRVFIYALLEKEFDEQLFEMMIENSQCYIFEYQTGSFKLVSNNLTYESE